MTQGISSKTNNTGNLTEVKEKVVRGKLNIWKQRRGRDSGKIWSF